MNNGTRYCFRISGGEGKREEFASLGALYESPSFVGLLYLFRLESQLLLKFYPENLGITSCLYKIQSLALQTNCESAFLSSIAYDQQHKLHL